MGNLLHLSTTLPLSPGHMQWAGLFSLRLTLKPRPRTATLIVVAPTHFVDDLAAQGRRLRWPEMSWRLHSIGPTINLHS